MIRQIAFSALITFASSAAARQPTETTRPDTAKATDAFTLVAPGQTHLDGLLGERYRLNAQNRLLRVDEEELLAGFRQKPGKQAWIGEHVGKWLHAASLVYANNGDPLLRAKLDRVVEGLLQTQEPDGYLGTYTPDKRWGLYPEADWDVWVHKYCLLGLLTYSQSTGRAEALVAARRIGDLLIATFGPGKKSLLSAGTHVGMAATSVLEPMVLLYRATGEARYLDFAKSIVASWAEENGPKILDALRQKTPVNQVANGKAYEMLSNLCGLCELYRATGQREYLDAVLNAWEDIVSKRLYLTGSGSSHELWQNDVCRPMNEGGSICETCVTVTWEQLNLQLLRLTGEARFADQLERTVYNHLLAAQTPGGDAWAYYTPLQGRKPYGANTNCCVSSGPRGVALLPTFAYMTTAEGVAVNLFTPSKATLPLPNGTTVQIEQQTNYPLNETVMLKITPQGGRQIFMLRLRVPEWTPHASLRINGQPSNAVLQPGSYIQITRTWAAGDQIAYQIELRPRLVIEENINPTRVAVMYGPLVLAADEGHNPALRPIERVALAADQLADGFSFVGPTEDQPPDMEEAVFQTQAHLRGPSGQSAGPDTKLLLTPFYAAGRDGSRFTVWFWRPAFAISRFALADETRSRPGNIRGSIVDEDPYTFVNTFDNTPADLDWYAVTLPEPVEINTVVFAHGRCFHDGGWFDTSAGKPRVQVRREKDGEWQEVAVLDSYPATNATAAPNVKDGDLFSVRFDPVRACAVRIVGKPANGNNPKQAFSSCGELRALQNRER